MRHAYTRLDTIKVLRRKHRIMLWEGMSAHTLWSALRNVPESAVIASIDTESEGESAGCLLIDFVDESQTPE